MNLKMRKDYALLIGKKFGDREILDIVKKYNGRQNIMYAICKCKCGSVDEIELSKLRAGRRRRCQACTEANRNLSTRVKNISYDRTRNGFVVSIERNGQKIVRRARTLDEAILIKKLLLEHFAKHGYFDTLKLNDSYCTREPKKKHNSHQRKDYSYLIGKTLRDGEIIHVDNAFDVEWRKRKVRLRDEQGRIKEIRLSSALTALKRPANKVYAVKSNTGVKNISYNAHSNRYNIGITRNGVTKAASAKTLEEAIKRKERILKEFEKEHVTNG